MSSKYYIYFPIFFPVVYYIIFLLWMLKIHWSKEFKTLREFTDDKSYVHSLATDNFYFLVFLSLLSILIWLFKTDLSKRKIVYFFIGLFLVILNTIWLTLANEFTVHNGWYLLMWMVIATWYIIGWYIILYFLIYFFQKKILSIRKK